MRTRLAYRWLWLQAAYWVLWNRWSLYVDPAGTVQRALLPSAQGRDPNRPEDWEQVRLTGRAASTAGAWIVDQSRPCLPIALATHGLLARQGYRALLRIGVQWSEGSLEGHAWVECAGRYIVGNPAPALVPLQPPNRHNG